MADRDLIDAVHDEVYALLLRHGVEDMTAFADADNLCETLQQRFGGRRHYWPRPDKTPRDIRIAAELRGTPDPKTVADKYGVSPRTVRRAKRKIEPGNGGFGSDEWNL